MIDSYYSLYQTDQKGLGKDLELRNDPPNIILTPGLFATAFGPRIPAVSSTKILLRLASWLFKKLEHPMASVFEEAACFGVGVLKRPCVEKFGDESIDNFLLLHYLRQNTNSSSVLLSLAYLGKEHIPEMDGLLRSMLTKEPQGHPWSGSVGILVHDRVVKTKYIDIRESILVNCDMRAKKIFCYDTTINSTRIAGELICAGNLILRDSILTTLTHRNA